MVRDLKTAKDEANTNLLYNTSTFQRNQSRRSSMNNNSRYNKSSNSQKNPDIRARKIPIIRETRSSRMRKSALVVDVMRKERTKIRHETSKLNATAQSNTMSGVRRPMAANSTSTKNRKIGVKERSTQHDNKHTSTANIRNNRFLDLSGNSTSNIGYLEQSFELVNSGVGSPRVNVHPDEFITGQSFNRYQRHKSPEKSLDDQAWRTLLDRYRQIMHIFTFLHITSKQFIKNVFYSDFDGL